MVSASMDAALQDRANESEMKECDSDREQDGFDDDKDSDSAGNQKTA